MNGRAYTPAMLASDWGCSDELVYGLIASGQLRAWKLGGKLWRINPEAVEEYECRQSTSSEAYGGHSPEAAATDTGRSSGLTTEDRTDARLARMIEPPQRPRLVHSGQSAS